MKWLNRCSQRRAYNCTSFKELLRHFQIERPRIVGRPKPALRHEGTRTAASTAQACLRKRVSLKSLVRDLRLHARICAGAVGQLAVLPRWQARVTTMSERESHIQHLFAAELQFRLASAVRLAVCHSHCNHAKMPCEEATCRLSYASCPRSSRIYAK